MTARLLCSLLLKYSFVNLNDPNFILMLFDNIDCYKVNIVSDFIIFKRTIHRPHKWDGHWQKTFAGLRKQTLTVVGNLSIKLTFNHSFWFFLNSNRKQFWAVFSLFYVFKRIKLALYFVKLYSILTWISTLLLILLAA